LFGDLVFALPDGETGPRAGWIGYEQETLLRPHPDIVTTSSGVPGPPRHTWEAPEFKLRDGVSALRWDSWPRIDDAIASYQVFRALRKDGVIPQHVRMQVGLPFPTSALCAFKDDFAHDFAIADPAYEDLVSRELRRLLGAVPAGDLAIQWDVCLEVLDNEGVLNWFDGDPWERFAGPVSRLTPQIPEEVLVGYHLCYGTWPEWPMYEARDMGLIVGMANHAVEHSGRPIDWLHLAGPRHTRSEDESFYRPLGGLRPGDARVFLGIVLPLDGTVGLQRRHATASKYLSDFGVAMYCGFGRQPGQDGIETMREHRRAAVSVSQS
jgi:hypothetical protein